MDAKPLSARMVMEVGSQRYNVICEWADEVAALESRVAELEKATKHLPPYMAESYATQVEEYRVEHGRPPVAAHSLRNYAAALRSADKGRDEQAQEVVSAQDKP